MRLTKEQQLIVNSTKEAVLVKAVAGSGKTTVMAAKVAFFLGNNISPKRILLLCHTQAGILSLKEKFRDLGVPPSVVKEINLLQVDHWAGYLLKKMGFDEEIEFVEEEHLGSLVHACAMDALSELSQLPIFDGHSSADFLGQSMLDELCGALTHLKSDPEGALFRLFCVGGEERPSDWDYQSISERFSINELMLRWAVIFEKHRVFREDPLGEKPWFRMRVDLLYDLLRMLKMGFELPHGSIDGLKFLGVDEAHDLSPAFSLLLSKVRLRSGQVMVVGDNAQRVYRSAANQLLSLDDLAASVGVKLSALEHSKLSYSVRFGQNIAQSIRNMMHNRPDVPPLQGLLRKKFQGDQVELDGSVSDLDGFLKKIQGHLFEGQCGMNFGDQNAISVLVIVPQDWQLPTMALRMAKAGLAFTILSKYQKRTMTDAVEIQLLQMLVLFCTDDLTGFQKGFLSAAFDFVSEFFGFRVPKERDSEVYGFNSARDAFISGTLSLKKIFLGSEFVEVYVSLRRNLAVQLVDILNKNADWSSTLTELFMSVRYSEWLNGHYALRFRAVQAIECVELIKKDLIESGVSGREFLNILQFSEATPKKEKASKISVLLASATSAKGFEADIVFVGPVTKKFWSDGGGAIIEQNRLYVAMSRAKSQLFLMFPEHDSPSCLKGLLGFGVRTYNTQEGQQYIDDFTEKTNDPSAQSALQVFYLRGGTSEDRAVFVRHKAKWNKVMEYWELESRTCPFELKKYLVNGH